MTKTRVITARFTSTCPACGGAVAKGDKVLWAPGEKVEHLKCPTEATVTTLKEKAKTRDAAWYTVALVGTAAGATRTIEVRERGGGRGYKPDLANQVGETRRIHVRGADNRYWHVLGAEAHYTSADQEEDMGQPGLPSGWWVTLHVREATEAESAALRHEDEAKTRVVAAVKAVDDALRYGATDVESFADDAVRERLAGRTVTPAVCDVHYAPKKTPGEWYAVTATEIYHYHPGYYDDYRPTLQVLERAGHEDVVDALKVLKEAS